MGFGRINVTVLPPDRALYVVKYLVKALRKEPGSRLWACCGYVGVRAADVVIEDSFWREVFSGAAPSGYSLGALRQLGLKRLYAKLFKREATEIKTTMQDKHHAAVIGRISKGEVVVVGEYRTTKIDTVKISSKANPSVKEDRVILRHAIELESTGAQATIVEWTAAGTRAEDVKLPLKKGQLVLVSVKKMNHQQGVTEFAGEVVPLS